MFFAAKQIIKSVLKLREEVHPFFGITFLVCKKKQLPIGDILSFSMDAETKEFLKKNHRICPDSEWFYQPFKSSGKEKGWLVPGYPLKGLQAINTQTFSDALSHKSGTQLWGWSTNYIEELKSRLPKKNKKPLPISAFDLAVWIYKYKNWPDGTIPNDVVNFFMENFHITEEEKDNLFSISIPPNPSNEELFEEKEISWEELRAFLPVPPDAEPEHGGTLAFLRTKGIGPADELTLEPAERLTLITGDNGLGKTFLLDCAWWALTGSWADRPALPSLEKQVPKAEIVFRIRGEKNVSGGETALSFDWKTQEWPHPKKRPIIPGLIVYARVDGSFAVWDPARPANSADSKSVYTGADVWDGLQGRIEGLIRDWVLWQSNPKKHPYETFISVLKALSPPDLGTIKPGEPVRIPGDRREIPTIEHRYGTIPVVYASAGVRRIITLAYLIVWAWNEHRIAAGHRRTEPQRRIVVLVDEMEAHLHPKWQRMILPALMRVGGMLPLEPETQFLIATHSPLVMASAEADFDDDLDSLAHFSLNKNVGEVSLEETDFIRFGEASSWLTSPVFGLKQARSEEAESTMEDAKALQKQDNPLREEVAAVSERLVRHLAEDDRFWPRWIAFAERYGVEL